MAVQHHANQITDVAITDAMLSVMLRDGRTISAPLDWFPRLKAAAQTDRDVWELCGAGYGLYWPRIDENLSVEGLLREQRAPNA